MKRIRKRIRFMLCMAVILFAMTTAVMGCYQKDPDTVDIPGKTPSGTSEQQTDPTSTPAGKAIPTVNRQAELADAKSKNPDAVAWLYIPGAEVDDPVMQAEDNGFYLNRDELREYSTWGCYYPRRFDLRGLDFGSGFVRFRLFLQLVLGRCFCNRFGGFGFFQRAGDDVN